MTTNPDIDRTGWDPAKCWAMSKAKQAQCQRPPMLGQKVCHKHGGSSPRARAAGAENIFTDRANRLLVRTGMKPVKDPLLELLRLASEAVAFKDSVAQLVSDLNGRIRFTDDKNAEQLRSEVVVYERAMDRAARILADITRLGIEERLAKVSEAQALALARVIDGVLTDLGHDPMTPAVAQVVSARLELLA